MKSVLFVAYEFPPAGGIEVQRIIKFIKYIRNHRINPIVLTTSHGMSRFMDYDLLNEDYILDTHVIRLGGNKTFQYHKFKNKQNHPHHVYTYYLGMRYIWFMDIYSSWFFEIKKHLKGLLEKNDIRCVFTTSPPASTHLIGEFIASAYRIPWIMDIRDSMVNNPNYKRSIVTYCSNKIATYYEKRFTLKADKVISVSQPIIDNMADRLGDFVYNKSKVIMNGYDAEDFNNHSFPKRDKKKLKITYTGSFLGRITPLYFLNALKSLIINNSVISDHILLNFVGRFSIDIKNLIFELRDQIEINLIGSVTHQEAIKYQQNSDLLLLILAPEVGKYANEVISGKIFEYMAAKKPVLGLIPSDGPLMNIFHSTNIGFTAKPDDVKEIAEQILTIYKQWINGGIFYHPNYKEIQNFTRERQTAELASIIDEVT